MQVLLHTHAMIYVAQGERLRRPGREAIAQAASAAGVLVSPVWAWELGLLVAKGRLDLDRQPLAWCQAFRDMPGVRLVPLSIAAATLASFLPGDFHADPADRLLVATARELDVPLVTRNREIPAYAEAGHLRAIAC